ncbi:MAG: hypothetical protein ACOC35_14680 [Promethearchaeia archaeon]
MLSKIPSTITILNGFSAIAIVCISIILLINYLYQCQKKDTNPLINAIFLSLAVALGWTGISITSLSVLIYGYNLSWVKDVFSYFSYSTVPIGALAIIYTTWDVAGSPKNKKYIVAVFIAFSLVYYLVLFTTFNHAVVQSDTGIIYDDWITPNSLFYYIIWGIVGLAALISGIGFNKFRKSTPGELHTRSLLLLSSTPIVGLSILLDTVIFMEPAVYLLFIPRLGMVMGMCFIFYGFRPSSPE